MFRERERLPEELLEMQLTTTGNTLVWKLQDIPQVIKVCFESGYAIIGGQTVFCLPDGTCELYWRKVDLKLKTSNESWNQYVERNGSEFLYLLQELVEKTDFEKEAVHSFDFLKEKKKAGINILDYLGFEVDMMSESNYLKYFSSIMPH